jgi:hypothetical protein
MLVSRTLTLGGVVMVLDNDHKLDSDQRWTLLMEAANGGDIVAGGYSIKCVADNKFKTSAITTAAFGQTR